MLVRFHMRQIVKKSSEFCANNYFDQNSHIKNWIWNGDVIFLFAVFLNLKAQSCVWKNVLSLLRPWKKKIGKEKNDIA